MKREEKKLRKEIVPRKHLKTEKEELQRRISLLIKEQESEREGSNGTSEEFCLEQNEIDCWTSQESHTATSC